MFEYQLKFKWMASMWASLLLLLMVVSPPSSQKLSLFTFEIKKSVWNDANHQDVRIFCRWLICLDSMFLFALKIVNHMECFVNHDSDRAHWWSPSKDSIHLTQRCDIRTIQPIIRTRLWIKLRSFFSCSHLTLSLSFFLFSSLLPCLFVNLRFAN